MAGLARSARRARAVWSELATAASALAEEVRLAAADASEAKAQRAGVLIAGRWGSVFCRLSSVGDRAVVVGWLGGFRLELLLGDFVMNDLGMSTVEYTIGLLAAAVLATTLLLVLSGGQVTDAITELVRRAFTVDP